MFNGKGKKGPWSTDAASSKAVIKKGPQGISGGGKGANERTVVLASTQRAMRLRNGKGGTFGTGELARISGREKLELIAEDEMQKLRAEKKKVLYESNMDNAVRAPFSMEVALKVAQSQMDAYIDVVNHLHKKDLCFDTVKQEIEAQVPKDRGPKDPDPMRSASLVSEQFGICVHNAYMMASGWTIIFESLRFMQNSGLADRMVPTQLKVDERLRTIYVLTFKLLKKLVDSGQQRLRSLVQNTDHYRVYFRASSASKDRQEFDDTEMRKMYKSFLDSTIIELCLPGSRFSPQALYSCLHAIEEESPKDLKRCPQLMWDAVGDLAEAVRLMDLMETPLLNAEGVLESVEGPDDVPEFAQWDEAQEKSIKAALQYSSYVNLVFPLENLQNEPTLRKAWDKINSNYIKETGKTIDALWQLVDVRTRVPHFTVVYVPGSALNGGGKDSASAKKQPLTIKASGEDSDSMPELVAVSDSEEEDYDTDSTDSSYHASDESGEDDFDEAYDTEEEEELKKMFREAMNVKTELDDEFDTEESSKSRNPFLKLLGNLKGRLFSPSSALRTDGKTTATNRPAPSKAPKKKEGADKPISDFEKQFAKINLDDGDDESDEQKSDKKKKKKPKKKKKKTATGDDSVQSPTVEEDVQSPIGNDTVESPTKDDSVQSPSSPPSSPVAQQKAKKASKASPAKAKAPSISSTLTGTTAFGSTTTLPVPTAAKAESAHSYLSNLGETKVKVKTRPDQPMDAMERRMFLPKFGGSKQPREIADGKEEVDQNEENTVSIFTRLKGKTTKLANRFFGVGDSGSKGKLRWEQFLQIMRELGFDYDPSTAGSSVRFDPPNPTDRSITFHKPHPDATLYPYKIREYRDKLAEYYDLTPDKFQKAMDEVQARSKD